MSKRNVKLKRSEEALPQLWQRWSLTRKRPSTRPICCSSSTDTPEPIAFQPMSTLDSITITYSPKWPLAIRTLERRSEWGHLTNPPQNRTMHMSGGKLRDMEHNPLLVFRQYLICYGIGRDAIRCLAKDRWLRENIQRTHVIIYSFYLLCLITRLEIHYVNPVPCLVTS